MRPLSLFHRPILAAALAAVVVLAATGCGSSSTTKAVAHGAPMEVSLNHGKTVLLKTRVAYGSNAMIDLKRHANVQTGDGGKFVSAVNGHAQNTGSSTYWLLYIDCKPASVGATEITIKKGETVWWDLRATGSNLPTTADPACPFKP